MTIKKNILKSALVISALFFLSSIAFAQGDILELLPGSKILKFNEKTGIHRLIGDVNFTYQGNIMYCDSAHYHERKKSVYAYGNVHINKRDTLNLFCDSLYYNGNTRKAKLWGHVRVRDSEYKLTTDSLDYDAGKSQASYHYGGRVESTLTQEVLTSKVGYFHPESKNFFFSHDVRYKGKDLNMTTDTLQYLYSQKKTYFYGPTNIATTESGWYNTYTGEGSLSDNAWIKKDIHYISGDTLLYNPDLLISIGIGNVYYVDTTQSISFTGDYALSDDSSHYSFLTGHALATKYMDDDTLYIHADTLYNQKADSSDFIKAYHNAKVYSTKMQCVADSIVFALGEDKIKLYDDPIVWSKYAELKGEFIDIDISDSTLHRINIYTGSSILMEVEHEKYYNQIAGKDIVALFRENNLYKALVNGNAMTLFFPEDEVVTDTTVTKKRLGMNRLYSSTLRIDVDSNELTGITYIDEPEGVFYPMDKIKKEEQFIPGFNWRQALRPRSMEDLFIEEEEEESH